MEFYDYFFTQSLTNTSMGKKKYLILAYSYNFHSQHPNW